MCGVAGLVVPPGREPGVRALERMVAALGHRGPDDRAVARVGTVGLGHTRLAIVDPGPAGRQPMSDAEGRWWLSYNGEVFNHEELRAALPPAPYRGHSDTETLLRALSEWGEGAIERCNGQFAFAALDTQGRRLLLARDAFGIKPLYLARHDGAIVFASELRALFAAGVPRRVRPDALRHTFERSWVGGRATPVEGIERVLPGSLLSVDLDTLAVSERRWYRPVDDVDPDRAGRLARAGREDAVDALEAELRASVARRLMSDAPVGTMCSGGLDSGLITAFAAAERPDIPTYVATVPGNDETDEGPWARAVAAHAGLDLRAAAFTTESLEAALVPTVEHFEYPLVVESALMIALAAGAARADGVKVMLTGESADELFAGYRGLRRHEFEDFAAAGRPLAAARAGLGRLTRRGRRSLRSASCADADRYERDSRDAAWRAYAHHRGARRRFETALADDLSTVLPHPLNRQDKNAMQHSVETRPPFLDPGVVGLVLNLPLEWRIAPDPKGIVRDLARRHLPRDVADRPKCNPATYGVTAHLRERGRAEFLERGVLRDLLEVPAEAWRRRIAEAPPYPAMQLWTGEIWCRAVVEGSPRGQVEADLWAA